MNYDLTRKVLAALEREGVQYAVHGAVALALHGLPRMTDSLDLFVAPEPDNIERLKTALRSVFDDPCIEEITAEDLLGEYPAVRYVPPMETFHIDVLARIGARFDFANLESETVDLDGLSVSTVTLEMLYRMHSSSARTKDLGDAHRIAVRLGLNR
jgi:hypothetical protein